MNLQLILPDKNFFKSYMDFVSERKTLGETIWESHVPRESETVEKFIDRLLAASINPESGLVPESIYWALNQNKIVGRIALRHELNEKLTEFGGHIGYEVLPSERKKGVATEMLSLILQTQKAKEIGHLLLTCDPANIGSNKTIIKNGGVLKNTQFVERIQRQTNYYWIYI